MQRDIRLADADGRTRGSNSSRRGLQPPDTTRTTASASPGRGLPSEKKLSSREEAKTGADAAGDRHGRGAMLMRSTGLGKAELIAEIVDITRQGDYLIMELQTLQPVRWKIRGGLSHKDIRMLLRVMAKRSVIGFFLNVRAWFKDPEHPGPF